MLSLQIQPAAVISYPTALEYVAICLFCGVKLNLSDSGGLVWSLHQALDFIYYRLIALHMMQLSPTARHSISDCENVKKHEYTL